MRRASVRIWYDKKQSWTWESVCVSLKWSYTFAVASPEWVWVSSSFSNLKGISKHWALNQKQIHVCTNTRKSTPNQHIWNHRQGTRKGLSEIYELLDRMSFVYEKISNCLPSGFTSYTDDSTSYSPVPNCCSLLVRLFASFSFDAKRYTS